MPADLRTLLAEAAAAPTPDVDVDGLVKRGRRRRRRRSQTTGLGAVALVVALGFALLPAPAPPPVLLGRSAPEPHWPLRARYEVSRQPVAAAGPMDVRLREFTGSGWDDWTDRGIDPPAAGHGTDEPRSPSGLFNARFGEPLAADEDSVIVAEPEVAAEVAARLGLAPADVRAERLETPDGELLVRHAWLPAIGFPLLVAEASEGSSASVTTDIILQVRVVDITFLDAAPDMVTADDERRRRLREAAAAERESAEEAREMAERAQEAAAQARAAAEAARDAAESEYQGPFPPACETAPPVSAEGQVVIFLPCIGLPPLEDVVAVARPGAQPTLRSALTALFAGPTPQERRDGYRTVFDALGPELLLDVRLDDGTAIVDLDPRMAQVNNIGTSAMSGTMWAQLDRTVFQFDTVEAVTYRLGGDADAFCGMVEAGPGCQPRARPNAG